MKTFTTSIYVPHQSKASMTRIDAMDLAADLERPVSMPADLCHGALDEIKAGEEFIILVNGTHERHEIKMRGIHGGVGKVKFMLVEPTNPEVHRFAEWRVKHCHLMSMKNGTQLQLRNFGPTELRKMIRHSIAKRERNLVTYR